jgi:hypothetical protein
MTWKIIVGGLVGGLGLFARPVGAGRTLTWYAHRRLERL